MKKQPAKKAPAKKDGGKKLPAFLAKKKGDEKELIMDDKAVKGKKAVGDVQKDAHNKAAQHKAVKDSKRKKRGIGRA